MNEDDNVCMCVCLGEGEGGGESVKYLSHELSQCLPTVHACGQWGKGFE